MGAEKIKTILVVSERSEVRMKLWDILRNEHFVVEAVDAEQAMQAVEEIDLNLIIADAPTFFADQCRLLKELEEVDAPKLLAVTNINMRPEQFQVLFDYGVMDILEWPAEETTVANRVRNILGLGKLLYPLEQTYKAELENTKRGIFEHLTRINDVTGIYKRWTFYEHLSEKLKQNPNKQYELMRMDVDRFKLFNDTFGVSEGDRLLRLIGDLLRQHERETLSYGYLGNDHFVVCVERGRYSPEDVATGLTRILKEHFSGFDFVVRIGIYVITDPTMDATLMCDRAFLALRSIKGAYAKKYAYYDESMRKHLLDEHEITTDMKRALEEGQFVPYFQPQYDFATGKLCGAEALVRWEHPEKGLIAPGKFLPIFEENGFITDMDINLWEQVCVLVRKWQQAGYTEVPISVNISRRDIYHPELCKVLTDILEKYELTPEFLRLEITETAYMDDAEQLIRVVDGLRAKGFFVEMDDFGSGYSSLNTLKDVPVDLLKLDMKFLSDYDKNSRSGNILRSVIRMTHWLKLPVLAEGVESKEQAEYLRSMGCFLMQGYYFAKPMTAEEFERVLSETPEYVENRHSETAVKGTLDFLDASVQSTLIFNSFVGGAMIMEQTGDSVEPLRINDEFYSVMGIPKELLFGDRTVMSDFFAEGAKDVFFGMLDEAARTGQESDCEIRAHGFLVPGQKYLWMHIRARLLAKSSESRIFYLAFEDISEQKDLMYRNNLMAETMLSIVESIPGGIKILNIGEQVTTLYASRKAAAMFGYEVEEYRKLITDDAFASVHPDDISVVRETLTVLEQEKSNEPFSMIYRERCKNGTYRRVRLTGHRVNSDNYTKAMAKQMTGMGVSCILEDLETRYAEKIEQERQSIFRQMLFDTIPYGAMQYEVENGEAVMKDFNDRAWQMLGYESREHFSNTCRERGTLASIHPEDLALAEEKVRRILDTKEDARIIYDHRVCNEDGSVHWVRTQMQREVAKSGAVLINTVFAFIASENANTEVGITR